jgi:capsule biosynthesis phosphatase
MKTLVIDLDGTLTIDTPVPYQDKLPNMEVIATLREYRAKGFRIVIHTARNMRTHHGCVGLINVHTLPIVLEWLAKHDVPYDEIEVGKPWCGFDGFYIDDKSVRPSEFISLSYEEIQELLKKENAFGGGGNE